MAGLWFKPVCDDLLGKIHRWWVNYERGEIFSTREWLDREGNKVDKPTRYASGFPSGLWRSSTWFQFSKPWRRRIL